MYTKTLLIFFFLWSCTHLFGQLTQPEWSFNTHSPIYGSTATDGKNIYFGNEGGELYSISLEGKLNWMIQLDGSIKSTPAIASKKLIINTSEGTLNVINTKTGKEIWKRKIGDEKKYDLWDYYFSSPIVEDNKIFLGLGDGSVKCLDLISGNVIWSYQTKDVVHASPLISSDYLYIGGFDGFLYKLNKSNGNEIWKFDTKGSQNYPKGEIQKSVLQVDDKVYVTCRGNYLYEIDGESGRELRNYFEPGSWIIATPTHVGDGLVFGTSDTQIIRKVSFRDFKPAWSAPVSMRVYSKIVEKNDKLYLGTFDGKVYELSSEGKSLSVFQSKVSKNNYELIYSEDGYFRKDILTLYGSNIPASEKLLLSLGGFAGNPIIHSDKLFITSIDGAVYSFPIK